MKNIATSDQLPLRKFILPNRRAETTGKSYKTLQLPVFLCSQSCMASKGSELPVLVVASSIAHRDWALSKTHTPKTLQENLLFVAPHTQSSSVTKFASPRFCPLDCYPLIRLPTHCLRFWIITLGEVSWLLRTLCQEVPICGKGIRACAVSPS